MNISSLRTYIASVLLMYVPEVQSQLASTMTNPIQEHTTLIENFSGPYHLKRNNQTKSGSITYEGHMITFSHHGIISCNGVDYQLESNNIFGIDVSIIDIVWHSKEKKFIFRVKPPLGKEQETEMSVSYIDAMCEGIINQKETIPLGSARKARLSKIEK